MLPVLIFRHVEHEGPGYLQDFLLKNNIPFKLICVDAHEPVPEDINNVSGLVFMGGYMSVNDSLPWINAEILLIQKAMEKKIPILGHCLGGQLIAKAMGSTISANTVTEIGWHPTTQIQNSDSRIWLQGLDEVMELFHWHSETFSLPAGASAILKSSYCDCQGFVKGNILGLQCHIEMTEEMVRNWIEKNREDLVESESVQSADRMIQDITARIARLNSIADYFYYHWITGLKYQ